MYVKLDKPPLGWTEGVGYSYVEPQDIRNNLINPPYDDDDLIVICGPPVFEHSMTTLTLRAGFKVSSMVFMVLVLKRKLFTNQSTNMKYL
jgi:hypothetical protein